MNITKNGSLEITFIVGVNEKDEPITTKQTFRNLNVEASTSSLLVVAETLGNLLGLKVHSVERVVREML